MTVNKGEWKIQSLNCESSNFIYLIQCKRTTVIKAVYNGETKRTIKGRISDHRGNVKNKKTETATGQYFNSPAGP